MEVLLWWMFPLDLQSLLSHTHRVSVLKGQLHELQEHRRVFHVSLHTVLTIPFHDSNPEYAFI